MLMHKLVMVAGLKPFKYDHVKAMPPSIEDAVKV